MRSIADLQRISEGILDTPEPSTIKSTPKNIDVGIKHVEVPDDFVNEILNFSNAAKKVSEQVEKKPETKLSEAERLEERITSLVERLTNLLKEAKQVMSEMTTTGMIGVGVQNNLLDPKSKKKKKNGSRPTNK